MEINESFQLASDFIQYTHANVFLTGNAGTGKTTFLKHCKNNSLKNTAIVAPTGVAAMNAGGTTIHSFFQLPFTPYIPGQRGFNNNQTFNDKNSLIAMLRINAERREVMQQLELLIIDEISMVRCDVLDAIDIVLQFVRNNYAQPFGGVQVLLIGDLYQLPPVVKDEEWQILSPYYNSPFFFNSKVIEKDTPVYVSLEKIYRQNDPVFVDLLNQVRNNKMTDEGFELLHERYLPDLMPSKDEHFITLTTHNHKADAINTAALVEIKSKQEIFSAIVEGDFYEKSYPAEAELKLKVGAQVMFIKNDTEKIRRYFNGKIGIVEKIETDNIFVLCDGEQFPIEVKKEKWRNIQYALDKKTNKVEENEIGSFTQFPLRLAWAITIHKSQGLTFEKAIIDAGSAFAPGQVYVALSRCTKLEGIILHSKIMSSGLKSDTRIDAFSSNQKTTSAQMLELADAKKDYQQNILLNLFDFKIIDNAYIAIVKILSDNSSSFKHEAVEQFKNIDVEIKSLIDIAVKFKTQLSQLFVTNNEPNAELFLQNRITAAATYLKKVVENIKSKIEKTTLETDSRNISSELNKSMGLFHKEICLKIFLLNGVEKGFEIGNYLEHKRKFVKPMFSFNSYAGTSTIESSSISHPVLYKMLRKKRDDICAQKNTPIYLVAGSNTLEEMCNYLPQTENDLNKIKGFGPIKTKQYGNQFLDIIREYCEENGLSSLLNLTTKKTIVVKKGDAEKKKKEKNDTKQVSFNLFKSGKNIEEIALERNLTKGTIETHLIYFIENNQIELSEILSAEKIKIISSAASKVDIKNSKSIKDLVPEEISYGEIRMVLAGEGGLRGL
jgi:hypothetical protein